MPKQGETVRYYEISGEGALGRLLAGVVCGKKFGDPGGFLTRR